MDFSVLGFLNVNFFRHFEILEVPQQEIIFLAMLLLSQMSAMKNITIITIMKNGKNYKTEIHLAVNCSLRSISSTNLVFTIKINDVKQLSASYITSCNSQRRFVLFVCLCHRTYCSYMKYTFYGFPLPETFSYNLGCDEVFQTFVMCICFEYVLLHYFTVEKHMAILMNRTYCWRYYLSF